MIEVAIVGAGPYGLSIAAHLKQRGIPFRIFGRPMDSWLAHMPKGMLLKSDGFASNIWDPGQSFTLQHFCSSRQIRYSDVGLPVGLDTFSAYGLAFQNRMVPELEPRLVTELGRSQGGFQLKLDNSEEVLCKRVILAVGITNFEYVPPSLAHLPAEFLSHSYFHHDLAAYKGRNVTVVGGGSSAIDIAGLLHDVGAEVHLIARHSLKFHTMAMSKPRPLWQRVRHPQSGLGPGLRSRFFSNFPRSFHHLPERIRLDIVRRALGPSGGWFAKEKVLGRVPMLLGYTPERAEVNCRSVRLHIAASDGSTRELQTEHIIASTGYRVDTDRLTFLSSEIRSSLKTIQRTPVLSSIFESSIPGLYFVGLAAANSFGPVMRFAFGAGFAARSLSQTMARALSRHAK